MKRNGDEYKACNNRIWLKDTRGSLITYEKTRDYCLFSIASV